MKKIDTVIFDWAGTTVDYGSFAPVQAFIEVFKEYGVTPTSEEVREPMGMLKIDHIRTMLDMPRISECWKEIHGRNPSEEDAQDMHEIFEEKLMLILDGFADPKPDTIKTIEKLRSMGVSIGSTTGYNNKMMSIVVPAAKAAGYGPDAFVTPEDVGMNGRPYPYMIFRNMELLGAADVRRVLKVGDTVSDIKEGKAAGVITAGVVIGSSEMGLSQEEYESLTQAEKDGKCRTVEKKFYDAGADVVFMTLEEIPRYIDPEGDM